MENIVFLISLCPCAAQGKRVWKCADRANCLSGHLVLNLATCFFWVLSFIRYVLGKGRKAETLPWVSSQAWCHCWSLSVWTPLAFTLWILRDSQSNQGVWERVTPPHRGIWQGTKKRVGQSLSVGLIYYRMRAQGWLHLAVPDLWIAASVTHGIMNSSQPMRALIFRTAQKLPSLIANTVG